MLPYYPVILPFWLVAAVLVPGVQSLHAVRVGTVAERKLWLLYWLCYVAGSWTVYLFDWLLYAPFYVLAICGIDLYYEVQVLVVLYLVLPRTLGIRDLQGRIVGHLTTLVAAFLVKLQALGLQTVPAAAAPQPRPSSIEDEPGMYQLLCAAAVTSSFEPGPKTIIHQLSPGDVVCVLEVLPDEAGTKLRASIEEPAGWITLLNRETGKRWAAPCDSVPGGGRAALQEGVLAAAAAAGLDPATLLAGGGLGAEGVSAGNQSGPASPEQAWEAMALLESQLSRADDPAEDTQARRAAQMLRQMLATLVQSDNPAMLTMAQTMMPDIGKIWANEGTREYLRGLLGSSAGSATGSGGAAGSGDGAGSSGALGSGSAGSGSGS